MKKEARLILGGGSALGLAHIGAIAALAEQFEITGIIGTSMGAIVGGLFASGLEPDEVLDIALDIHTRRLFNPLHLDIRRSGIFDGKALLKSFRAWTGDRSIEDCGIPFVAIAYDLVSRRTVLIDKGSLAQAMRASSSLPYIFAPLALSRYLFVDGGVEHPLPVAFADRVEGRLTIAVNVLPPVSANAEAISLEQVRSTPRMRPHQVFVQSLMHNQSYVAVQALLSHPPDLIIDAHHPRLGFFRLDKAREFYEHGYRIAGQSIVAFREPSFRDQLLKRYQTMLSRISIR
jgi:NTE family protein